MTQKILPTVDQRSTKDSLNRRYYIYNDDQSTHVNETVAISEALTAFNADTGLVATNSFFERESDHSATVDCEWSPGKLRRLQQPELDDDGRAIQWRFQFQAQGKLVKHAITRQFAVNADPTFPRGVMGVAKVGGVMTPRGVQVSVPPTTFSANFHLDNDEISPTLIRKLGLICGSVAQGDRNDESKDYEDFQNLPTLTLGGMTFEEGEIFLSSVNGGQIDGDRWVINLGISFQPNVTRQYDLVQNGATQTVNYNQRGHDHLWVYEDVEEVQFLAPGGANVLVPTPKALFVDQVWYYEDWSKLRIPKAFA